MNISGEVFMKKLILILVIMVVTALAMGCASDSNSGVQEVKPSTDASEPEAETAAPINGSYENPASIGETVVISSSGDTFEFSIKEIIRGEKADYIVYGENEFNEKAAPGYEYLFVHPQVAYTEGSNSAYLSSIDFKAFCEGVACVESFVVVPNSYKAFSGGDVMPGAVKDGWIIYTVPQGKEVIMSYQPNIFSSNEAYISIGK